MFDYMYGQQNIIRVSGEPGARAYSMGPNSSALLLDETAPLIWAVFTDGAGYKTLKPYSITEYIPAPAPDIGAIISRLEKLEEKYKDDEQPHITNNSKK